MNYLKTGIASLLLLTTAKLICGQDDPRKSLTDNELLAAVNAAAKKGAKPDTVEDIVGVKATVNTRRKYGWGFLRFVSPKFDNPIPPLDTMKDVVYWIRPIKTKDDAARVVGIAWSKSEDIIVFTGTFYPNRF